MSLLRENIGCFRVRRLMRQMKLHSSQSKSPRYKPAAQGRPDIPNHLNRQFRVQRPNPVWCGDITYIWAQGRWYYLAVVLDMYSQRVVGWAFSSRADTALVIQALDNAFEQRGKP